MSVAFSSGDNLQKMIEKYNQELMRTYQRSALSQQPAAVLDNTPPPEETVSAAAVPAAAADSGQTAAAIQAEPEPVVPARVSIEAEDEWVQETSPEDNTPLADGEENTAAESPDTADEPESTEPTEPVESAEPAEPQESAELVEAAEPPAPEKVPHPEDEIGQLQVRVFAANSAIPIGDAYVAITRNTPDGEELFMVTSTDRSGFTQIIEVPTVARALSQTPGEPTPYTTYNILVHVPGFYTVRDRRVPVYSGITSVQPVELIPLPEGYTEEEDITFTEGGPADL
ncbi:MAG: hypothetical protein KHX46_03060 [Clostridiales bacterium]|nr:hypothetical protein [Clostridiales bacterium]